MKKHQIARRQQLRMASTVKKHRLGARSRHRMLMNALADPQKASPMLIAACSSQGGLAALRVDKEGIEPMSLNTLKAAANATLEGGGWNELDELRMQLVAHVRLTTSKSGSTRRGSKQDLLAKLKDIENRLDQERRARAILNRAYTDVITKLRSIATTDERLKHELSRHVATFSLPVGFELVDKD